MVDQKNGSVMRTIDTSKADSKNLWTVVTHKNIMVLIECDHNGEYRSAYVYENEVFRNALQLRKIPWHFRYLRLQQPTLAGKDFLLLHDLYGSVAVVDLKQTESNPKFKTIHLDKAIFAKTSLVWMETGKQMSTGVGYLFASKLFGEWFFRSQVYELNLNTVVDGSSITPMQVPFMDNYGARNVYFIHAVGTNAILCYDLCGKQFRDYDSLGVRVNVLHLECFNDQ